jgi:hypothetical protein
MIAAIIICVGGVSGVLYKKYWIDWDLHDDPSLGQLIRFQNEKIGNLPAGALDTIFVGDSSLGNAVDANYFNQISGAHSVNLALTGSFAYAGALVMLQEAAKSQPIKNVVLYFTIDALGRGNDQGYFFAGGSLFKALLDPAFSWRDKLELFSLYANRLLDMRTAALYISEPGSASIPPSFYRDDYLMSDTRISLASDLVTKFRMPETIERQALPFLRSIAEMCRKRRWNCLYVHGTILARLVLTGEARSFTRKGNQLIREAGFHLVNDGPILLQDDDRGDTVYHLRRDRRRAFTRKLYDDLRCLINPQPHCDDERRESKQDQGN